MTAETAGGNERRPLPEGLEPLTGIVTTDLAAVTRGRFVPARRLEKVAAGTGVGWLQADLSLTPFNTIVHPNPWGSTGDLRLIPDLAARFRTTLTGTPTPFDLVCGDLVELDGTPWACCPRTLLRAALADLTEATGLTLVAAFEHEFLLTGGDTPSERGLRPAHAFAFEALRRTDPFAPRLMAALDEAGVEPDVVIAEYGADQFEITHAPCGGLAAADRAVAIREITREIARGLGWRASFSPKTAPDAVGNGVHIHFSLADHDGRPATYDADAPGGLSAAAGAFCAGVLAHLPAITAFTASSVPSYLRLKPHTWSASYTSLAVRDREATLRICPVTTIGGRDPAGQYNIEFRAADATANPYLALAAIVRAGLEGLHHRLPAPPLVVGDPEEMTEAERRALGLVRLPTSLAAALDALAADPVVRGWFAPVFLECFEGVKRGEIAHLDGRDPADVCALYRTLF
jgi:glutamine synthetase